MQKKIVKAAHESFQFLMFFGLIAFLCGCGGGGSNSSSGGSSADLSQPATINSTQSAKTAAVQAISSFSTSSLDSTTGSLSLKAKEGSADFGAAYREALKPVLQTVRAKKAASTSCSSGSASMGWSQSSDYKTFTLAASYNNCAYSFYGVTSTTNGKITASYTNPSWSSSLSDPSYDFVKGIKKITGSYTAFTVSYSSGDSVKLDGTVSMDMNDMLSVSFSNITESIVASFTSSGGSQKKITYDQFSISFSNPSSGTKQYTLNGKATYWETGIPSTWVMSYSNYVMTEAESSSGTTRTFNGDISMQTTCLTGKLTVKTVTPVFTPKYGSCPTSGKISATGSGAAEVVYTSSGGVEIYLNGSLNSTASSCSELEADSCPFSV